MARTGVAILDFQFGHRSLNLPIWLPLTSGDYQSYWGKTRGDCQTIAVQVAIAKRSLR
ncbi:MAG: hypothetical protein SAL07_01895 [Oscillatoria sp. PMC 1051.18]|nr:hypothetical protein [Oscillatoria sp. PMC 1051.18]